MKIVLISLVAASLITGVANVAIAQDTQDTTVIHKESADGARSKTVVKHYHGLKTVKKVHTDPNGDKTVVKKSTD